MQILIPKNEIQFKTSKSSGPGGQKVNKIETKVQLTWSPPLSLVLEQEQKTKIIQWFKNNRPGLIDSLNNLQLTVQEQRSQKQNKEVATERLSQLVNQALKPIKKRIPTRTPKRVEENRLADKKQHSQKKDQRRIRLDELI